MELCKLNRNNELMYVQAVLPMAMARRLRGLSRRLVTKEQKIATVEETFTKSHVIIPIKLSNNNRVC